MPSPDIQAKAALSPHCPLCPSLAQTWDGLTTYISTSDSFIHSFPFFLRMGHCSRHQG